MKNLWILVIEGIFDRIKGKKEEDEKKQQKKDTFWVETNYGFAPKDMIKVFYSPEREEFPKYAGRPQEAVRMASPRLVEAQEKLDYLEKKVYHVKELSFGSCINCKKNFLIPVNNRPIFFKCPFCSHEDQKRYIEFLLHLNPDNEIFTNCPSCDKYNYITVIEQPRYISFNCKACNNEFLLSKDHEIKLGDYTEMKSLNWCSACGNIFEHLHSSGYPINCPRCDTQLQSKS